LFAVAKINWPEYTHCPEVKVYAGYCDKMLWLSYTIKNDYLRVCVKDDHGAVWEDSCVEFFIGDEKNFYNFEFNSLGACYAANGPDRYYRAILPDSNFNKILRFSSFSKDNLPPEGELCDWELTVAIPLSLLGLTAGSGFYGNFYKCGARTLIPHFLSWKPIDTPKPDFYRPEYFGAIELSRLKNLF
jgi:hypothetical protein